jgi:DNA-binding response OmpR family regulator
VVTEEFVGHPAPLRSKTVKTFKRMQPYKFIPPAETKTWEVPDPDDQIAKQKTILLLEDEVDFSALLKDYLESFNYSVTVVTDGAQGMRKVMDQDFDFILCDLLMPNVPGDMFFVGVERVKPHLSKRFIFITGHKGNPRVMDFLKRNKGIALFKPFEMHLLLDALKVVEKNTAKPQ